MSSSGVTQLNSGPLVIRTYNDSTINNTYVMGRNDVPVSSNYVLTMSTNGLLISTDRPYISSISSYITQCDRSLVSSLVGSTIYYSTMIGSTISTVLSDTRIANVSTMYFSTLTGSTFTVANQYFSTLTGSTVTVSNLYISTLYGSTISSNITSTNQLFVSSILGGDISTNTSEVNTATANLINTVTINAGTDNVTQVNSGAINNTYLITTDTLQVTTSLTADTETISTSYITTLNTDTINASTLTLSSLYVESTSFSSLLGSTITVSTINVSILNSDSTIFSSLFGSTINVISLTVTSTFYGASAEYDNISGQEFDVSTLNATNVNVSYLNTQSTFFSTMIGSSICASTICVSSLTAISIINSTLYETSTLTSSMNASTIVFSSLYGMCEFVSTSNISTLGANSTIFSSLLGSTIIASSITVSTLYSNTTYYSSLLGSSITTSTVTVSSLGVNSTVFSSLLGSTITVSSLTVSSLLSQSTFFSSLIGSTITVSSLGVNSTVFSSLLGSTITVSTIAISTLNATSSFFSTMVGSTLTVTNFSAANFTTPSFVVSSLTTPFLTIASTTISLGQSTNQTYANLSNGSYTNWVSTTTSLSLSNIKRVAMSSNGLYQLIVIGSSTTLRLSSNSGLTWSTLGSSNGLPAVSTEYTYGAISANGQYMLVCETAGSIYVSSDYGTTFTNASLPSVSQYIWLKLENNMTETMGNSSITTTGTMNYTSGKVGNYALNLINTPGSTATNYFRGSMTAPANITITGWVNIPIINGNYQIIFCAFNGAIQFYIATTNVFTLAFASGSSTALTTSYSTFTPSANTWYHFAIIFQTNGTCSLYINGTLICSGTNSGGYGTLTPLTTYSFGTYDYTTSLAFSGYLDDIRIYNYAIPVKANVPQNWTYCAMSGTGQYQVALSSGSSIANPSGYIYYSANYGSTWALVPLSSAATTSTWSSLTVSNTGQYMIATGGNIIPNSSAASTASPSWNANGVGWMATTSSILNTSFYVQYAFDFVLTNRWVSSLQNYTSSSNTSTYTTSIIGIGTISGEWIQLQSSVPLVLSSYMYSCSVLIRTPKSFYIVGSNDGSNWYPLHYCASMDANPYNADYVNHASYIPVSYSGSALPFKGNVAVTGSFTNYSYTSYPWTFFRVIFRTINNASLDYVDIGGWHFNFNGGVTYSMDYGTTWTTANTTSIIPTSPSAISGNGQYSLMSMNGSGQTALINSNYISYPYTSANGCILYYPFNDYSGTSSVMEVMGGYHATDKNISLGSTGKVGSSASCSGTYFTVPAAVWPLWTTLSAGSIACWVNPNASALTGDGQLFSKYISGSFYHSILLIGRYYNGTSLVAGTPGKVYFGMSNTQYSAGCSSNTALLANVWSHIVVTFNGSAIQFYINGVLDNTFYCNWTLTGTPSDIKICTGVSYPFSGYMDEFSLWNVALPQNTITALYNAYSPTLTSINSAIVGAALSYTGQYQVLVTGSTTNNLYYSTNYGQTFTGITFGSSLTLLGCTCSFDGSYITVYTSSNVYTLNNNTNGNTVSIGYRAGNLNQGANAISIGSYAGVTNQSANSIVLNATGSTINANTAGFFVGPIQPYSATNIPASTLSGLGYGTDNQVVSVPLPIGVGQTYSLPSRSLGTTYTNSTGRPIFVLVSLNGNSGSTTSFLARGYVNDVQIWMSYASGSYNAPVAGYAVTTVYLIVPHSSTYRITTEVIWGANGYIQSWSELS